MSNKNTSTERPQVRESLPADETDWAAFDRLTEDEVHAAALSDPDGRPFSAAELARMDVVPNVKRLRERLGMTQEQFALSFRLPLGTVRDWEQRRRFPDAPARALLRAIDREPETLRRLLAPAA